MKRKRLLGATALAAALVLPTTPALAVHRAPLITTDPHSAASALARGQALLRSIALPSGVHWRTPVPEHSGRVESTQTVIVSRSASGKHAGSPVAYWRQHPPGGLVAGESVAITPHQVAIDYQTTKATNTSATLTVTWSGSSVSVFVTVVVGWVPLRTADERVPATVTAVDVEVWPPDAARPVPTFGHQVVHATGPAVHALIHYLDSLQPQGPMGYGAGACTVPLFYGSDPVMRFAAGKHQVVFRYVNACQLFAVTVDGKARPRLQITGDPTALVMTRLLHLVPVP
ncbi:hypothetical protein acdb102_19320 [Acidothermaceae bacterium B102]|nr:hypothetical protein acdb102_19320 [Acidothermaceae bacterium B102]